MPEKQGYRPGTADQKLLTMMLNGRDTDDPWGFTTPSLASEALDFSSEYATNRLSMLHAAGLVTKPVKGLYVITDDGIGTVESDER